MPRFNYAFVFVAYRKKATLGISVARTNKSKTSYFVIILVVFELPALAFDEPRTGFRGPAPGMDADR